MDSPAVQRQMEETNGHSSHEISCLLLMGAIRSFPSRSWAKEVKHSVSWKHTHFLLVKFLLQQVSFIFGVFLLHPASRLNEKFSLKRITSEKNYIYFEI